MTTDQWVATFSAAVSFLGLLLVFIQLRENNEQSKLQSQIRIYDINRELISLGFSHPQLFEVLRDAKGVDPTWEQHYLQLWLNQLSLVYAFEGSGVFSPEVQASFDIDLRDMMKMVNLRRHWARFGKYYPASFQKYVNGILAETGGTTSEEATT